MNGLHHKGFVMVFSTNFLILALFLILNTVGLVIVTFLARELWPLLRKQMILNGKEQQARLIDMLAQAAVAQAEQIYENNEDKKRAAVSFLERELMSLGIPIDPARTEQWIEAKVFGLLNQVIGFIPEE